MDPYVSPAARVADAADAPQSPSGKAVLFGVLCATGVPLMAAWAAGTVYYLTFGIPGENDEQLVAAIRSPWFIVIGIAVLILGPLVGAYVCARTARHSEYRLGVFVTLIYALLVMLAVGGPTLGATFLLLLLTMPLAMAGAHAAVRRNRADAQAG